MKEVILEILFKGLGDNICITPVIKKISIAHNSKIDIISVHPDIFKNNPYVNKSGSKKDLISINKNCIKYTLKLDTYLSKDEKHYLELKHNCMDIRQYYATLLGFNLLPNEMSCEYYPDKYEKIKNLPEEYIVIHPTQTWPSRTWDKEKWQQLIDKIDYPVVAIGKDSSEVGFFNVQKPSFNVNIKYGLNLINKTNISQTWHVINKAKAIVTMDSGMLHLAGTTDTHIFQLGSSINPFYRAPYRKGSQTHNYTYIKGPCNLYCGSNLKYGVKEWGNVLGVPPLVSCLENKKTFECHPTVNDVIQELNNIVILEDAKNWEKRNEYGLVHNTNKENILFITPHLSTGGLPQVLLKRIEYLKKSNKFHKIGVIEWTNFSDKFDVQKKKIKEIVDYFKTLSNENKDKVQQYIKEFEPDIIHFEEFPEHPVYWNVDNSYDSTFKNMKLINSNINYKIVHTCHTSKFNETNKIYKPDKYFLAGSYHEKLFENIIRKTNYEVIDYPVEKTKNDNLLNPYNKDITNFLIIGLFNKNKNQKYIFDLAQYIGNTYAFYFIGNMAENFKDYWKPLLNKKPDNCHILGELDNVDEYLKYCDGLIIPSFEEFNPIVIYEAMSYDKPIFLNGLETYKYIKENEKFKYLTFSFDKDVKLLNTKYDITYKDTSKEYFESVNNFYDNIIIDNSRSNLKNVVLKDIDAENKIIFGFQDGPKCEILGNDNKSYYIEFIDSDTNRTMYTTTIANNHWCACSRKWYTNWIINVYHNKVLIESCKFNARDERIYIAFESKSLGDNIAWMPYVDEFRRKHKSEVVVSTFHNNLFEEKYPSLIFKKPGEIIKNVYAKYSIGIFGDEFDINKNPSDTRKIPLQKICSDILGLEYMEIKTKIKGELNA